MLLRYKVEKFRPLLALLLYLPAVPPYALGCQIPDEICFMLPCPTTSPEFGKRPTMLGV